jgi:hypothetical protein
MARLDPIITPVFSESIEAITAAGSYIEKNLLPNAGAYGGDSSTLPTGWATQTNGSPTATISVAGYGNSSLFQGAKYADFQIVNNYGSARNLTVKLHPDSPKFSASTGDNFALSIGLELVTGTYGGNARFMLNEFAGASYLGTVTSGNLTVNSTMARRSAILTTAEATVDGVNVWLRFYDVPDGSDFIVRITTPQVEKSDAVTSYQNTGY